MRNEVTPRRKPRSGCANFQTFVGTRHACSEVKVDALLADEAGQDGWLEAIAEFQAGVRKASQDDYENDDLRNELAGTGLKNGRTP
jgi:hypothetical protein